MGRLFGTDGIRGIANRSLDSILAYKLGQAVAIKFNRTAHQARILIGKDTRISGDMLESALVAGICSAGAVAETLGVVPTPAVAYLTRFYKADAGIVISASHNSVEYNGLKVFNAEGYKLADEIEDEIELMMEKGMTDTLPEGVDVGHKQDKPEAFRDYLDFLKTCVGTRLDGLKIAIDAANGAASYIAPVLYSDLGAEVISMGNTPDGNNINDSCGSTHPEKLQRLVKKSGADIGLAFDGDADRLIAVDENGEIVNGDTVMGIISVFMKNKGLLKKDTLVGTVMSNLGLKLYLAGQGIKFVETAVGDRYVLEEMIRSGYNLGGEQSGHVILLDRNTTGDGMLTALSLLEVLVAYGKKLSVLASDIRILPQVLVNVKVNDHVKEHYRENAVLSEEIRSVEEKLHGKGRVLIRPSGTEPLVRVMLEGEDIDEITVYANRIAALIGDIK